MLSSDLKIERITVTPEDLMRSLRGRPYAFWLDSAVGPDSVTGWSFIGSDPFMILECKNGKTVMREGSHTIVMEEGPLEAAQRLLKRYEISPEPGAPPFIGGAVGWFSYDLARQYERLPTQAEDDTHLPEMQLAFYRTIYAFQRSTGKGWGLTREELPEEAVGVFQPSNDAGTEDRNLRSTGSNKFNLTKITFTPSVYVDAVHRLKEYIAGGDIYQANLTQRFARPFPHDPFDLYQHLRRVNPAPFAAYLGFGDMAVLSASPERFLSVDAVTCRVETRPIKGTRPRSSNSEEDARLANELQHSEKDRAENLMIVDVHRNDLGRVCEVGSVKTPTLWGLESYATVHHLVSVVEGRLPEHHSPLELVRSAFPAGSITGAPKLRAMEIIEELEPVRRGIYTGAIGYLGWDGGMDLSVAIRTMIAQEGWVHYGVGGGIVADSDPEAEYRETLDKARGLEQALSYFRD